MKKVLFVLLIVTALGLVLAACNNPSLSGTDAALARAVALNDADKLAAVSVKPTISVRTNASGKDISSNAQGAAVPGMYFFWDPKQKDNGYLKVETSLFDDYASFILTTKEANKYLDFLIAPKFGQPLSADGFYVFFIPKQEKNINGVWISDYVKKVLVPQALDYTEFVGDVPNPDRGFYRPNDGFGVPKTGGTAQLGNATVGMSTIANGSSVNPAVQVDARLIHCYFGLQRYATSRYNRSNIVGEPGLITADGLAYIRNTLQRVRDIGGQINPRFTYDPSGNYEDWIGVEPQEKCGITDPVLGITPDMEWWEAHIKQVKPILQEYEDVIWGVDAGFFGPWSEMHTTQINNRWNYKKLLDAMLDAVPASRNIMVHCGGFLAWYNATYSTDYDYGTLETVPAPVRGTPESRIGMFNDCYASGIATPGWPDAGIGNDNGSISEGYQLIGDGGDLANPDKLDPGLNRALQQQFPERFAEYYKQFIVFDRSKILNWLRNQDSHYGGEASGGNNAYIYSNFPSVGREASIAQTSYMNHSYNGNQYARWNNFRYTEENVSVPLNYPDTSAYELGGFIIPGYTDYAIYDPVYEGRTGLEFFRDRLGYRLVVREAGVSEWVPQGGTLKFAGKVQNVGFGNVLSKKNVYAILKNADTGTTYTALTNVDPRDWRSELDNRPSNIAAYGDLNFSVPLSAFGSVPAGSYDIYLKINDPAELSANMRCIRFANKGDVWNADLGANLVGTTIVY